jgi:hypothetical protein
LRRSLLEQLEDNNTLPSTKSSKALFPKTASNGKQRPQYLQATSALFPSASALSPSNVRNISKNHQHYLQAPSAKLPNTVIPLCGPSHDAQHIYRETTNPSTRCSNGFDLPIPT